MTPPVEDRVSPKVSINIPTLNCAEGLERCLQSIRGSSFKDFEVLILDGGSSDRTREVALSSGAIVIDCGHGLLRARIAGIRASQGDYVLMLDSDQRLKPETLDRALEMAHRGFDMVILEEQPDRITGLVSKLWWKERSALSINARDHTGLAEGSLLPRFIRREPLLLATSRIPTSLYWVRHPDHQIIYAELLEVTDSLNFLDDAIAYNERTDLIDILRTYFRHGRDAARLAGEGHYRSLIAGKNRSRLRGILAFGPAAPASLLLYVMRSIPFAVGYSWEAVLLRARPRVETRTA
jgi:glycosyltransferase involved in cell wall biosynthesis